MLLEVLQRLNVLDILFFLIFFRVVNISLRKGVAIEFFKLFGTYLSTYISLHYYTVLADRLRDSFGFRTAPIEFLDFVSFIILIGLSYGFVILLRLTLVKIRADEALTSWSRWSGMALGVARGVLVAGLISYGMAISTLSYFKDQINDSMMGGALFDLPIEVYSWTWENVAQQVSRNEKFNTTIQEVKKSVRRPPGDSIQEEVVPEEVIEEDEEQL